MHNTHRAHLQFAMRALCVFVALCTLASASVSSRQSSLQHRQLLTPGHESFIRAASWLHLNASTSALHSHSGYLQCRATQLEGLRGSLFTSLNTTVPGEAYPAHKPLWPLTANDWWLFSCVTFTVFLAAGGGIGGGGVLVPLLILVGGFGTRAAVALSNITIVGGALANFACNVVKRHPCHNRPLIDWELILVMEPSTILGALLGSYFNKILPTWFTTICLTLLLTFMTTKLLSKALYMYVMESEKKRAAAERPSLHIPPSPVHTTPPPGTPTPVRNPSLPPVLEPLLSQYTHVSQHSHHEGTESPSWRDCQPGPGSPSAREVASRSFRRLFRVSFSSPSLLSLSERQDFHRTSLPEDPTIPVDFVPDDAPFLHTPTSNPPCHPAGDTPHTPSTAAYPPSVRSPPVAPSTPLRHRLASSSLPGSAASGRTVIEGAMPPAMPAAQASAPPTPTHPNSGPNSGLSSGLDSGLNSGFNSTSANSGGPGVVSTMMPAAAASGGGAAAANGAVPAMTAVAAATAGPTEPHVPLPPSAPLSHPSLHLSPRLAAQLSRLEKSEARQVPLEKLSLLLFLSAWTVASDSLKVQQVCGSWRYWLVVVSIVPVIAAVTLWMRRGLLRKGGIKGRAGVAHVPGEVVWDAGSTLVYPAVCSLAGVIAGMFGVGGGIVKGPLMLEMGVDPQVAAASSTTMILFTSLSASIVYWHWGRLQYDYGTALLSLAFLVTLAGQLVTNHAVRALGRRSIIVFLMASLMATAAAVMYCQTGRALEWAVAHPDEALHLSTICENEA